MRTSGSYPDIRQRTFTAFAFGHKVGVDKLWSLAQHPSGKAVGIKSHGLSCLPHNLTTHPMNSCSFVDGSGTNMSRVSRCLNDGGGEAESFVAAPDAPPGRHGQVHGAVAAHHVAAPRSHTIHAHDQLRPCKWESKIRSSAHLACGQTTTLTAKGIG